MSVKSAQPIAQEQVSQGSTFHKQASQNYLNQRTNLPSTEVVLANIYWCHTTLQIRAQNLSSLQMQQVCEELSRLNEQFHLIFDTQNKPVADDHSDLLRVNIYADYQEYQKYAGFHFKIPTDNGGIFIEGEPEKIGNRAEFIVFEHQQKIWNLRHEYVHYLDARFNLYGDFCQILHDSHLPPENCPKPAPALPHMIWWHEGMAEYLAKGDAHYKAFTIVSQASTQYVLSELFNTSYVKNGGGRRVYYWGYFASRYMLEQQREKVEQMLSLLRQGETARYQALVRQWGKSMDKDFAEWLDVLLRFRQNEIAYQFVQ
ncbi:collagenase [Aliikangiella maris]|uniref:Collagenase n=2 Tax=Aliikangiella maris TaxID=3162458 RepID=A0ABV3MT91_9GAMM